MYAEVIAFGDELTTGQRLDTNSRWLAEQLTSLGIRPIAHTAIGDDLPLQTAALQAAIQRADVVVCTGGLGPTDDDLTREAIAEALGQPLELREDLLAQIEALFTRRGRDMPERNRKQAALPLGAAPVPNPHGTAPGVLAEAPRDEQAPALVIALPGVPAEMKQMWEETIAPLLAARYGGSVIVHRGIKCFGLGESELESRLPNLIARGRNPLVGITVHQATITLRISAAAADRSAAQELIAPVEQSIRELLGDIVYGEEEEELADVVAKVLRELNQRVAVLDCVSKGLVGVDLSRADASRLAGHVQAASAQGGMRMLGVSEEFDDDAALAGAAAEAVRTASGADYGLAITPSADPERALIAVSDGSEQVVRTSRLAGHPDVIAPRTAKAALDLLRRRLLSLPLDPR